MVDQEKQQKNQINYNPIKRFLNRDKSVPQKHVEPYVRKGQVVADLGCNTGYYTLALAECVGPEGKVYAVDLNEKAIQTLEKEADKFGYHNIEAYASSVTDLSFIKDRSIDFVLANGILCVMAGNRESAVNEIKRIMKPNGKAYLSLGSPPPLGHANRAEWEKILDGFRVERRGGFLQKWALVSLKQQ
ncbi:MAG TPA: class I SAM-dependent methyltransferase [candidate division Zixibacteria bacterium]|nr:class I SAM-dependent methyltransferase [candidate division Zixibacteria bacterium]